jgi:pyruvate dehydrogenase (quinone)
MTPRWTAAIAAGAGLCVIRVTDPAKVRACLAESLAHPGPVLVDVVTDPNALSIPPHITTAQLKGFALAASKVGKTVELARSNLRNIPRP